MNRNIAVMLSARDMGLTATLTRSAAAMSAFQAKVNDAGRQLAASSRSAQQMRTAGLALIAVGGGIAAVLGLATAAAMRFDVEMSALGAVSGAAGEQMDQLRQQALDMGAATKFSATEAAQAQVELARAGMSVADILGGGLQAALALAAAGEIELGRAAEIVTTTMNTFGLEASEAMRVADALAAGANASAATMDDLAMGLQQVGQVAAMAGLTVEETTGALALMNNEGLRGSDAGTSLRTMFLRLLNPVGQTKKALDLLGVSLSTSSGEMRPMSEVMDEIVGKLGRMTEAQRTQTIAMLGGADASRAISAIFNEGVGGLDRWTQRVTAQGAATELAAKMTDNLAGDLERLRGSIETALINIGSKGTGVLRSLAETATDAVNVFNGLPAPVQTAIVVFAALASGTLLLGGAMAALGPRIVAARLALEGLGVGGRVASTGLGMLGTVLGKGGLILGGLFALDLALDSIFGPGGPKPANIDALERSLTRFSSSGRLAGEGTRILGEDFGNLNRDSSILQGSIHAVDSVMSALTFGQVDLHTQTEITDEAFAALDQTLTQMAASDPDRAIRVLKKAAEDANIPVGELLRDLPQFAPIAREMGVGVGWLGRAFTGMRDAVASANDEVTRIRKAGVGATPAMETLDQAMQVMGDTASTSTARIQALKDVIDGLIGTTLGAFDAATNYQAAVDALDAAVAEHTFTLDANSAAGRAVREALSGVAHAAIDEANAVAAANGSAADGVAVLQLHRAELVNQVMGYGVSREAAERYVTTVLGIPENVETLVNLANEDAERKAEETERSLDEIDGREAWAKIMADNRDELLKNRQSKDRLFDWDRSSGTASVNADGSQADRTFVDKVGKLLGWDRSSGSADVNARDNASNIIRNVGALLSGLDGRTATTYVTTIHSQVSRVIDGRYVVRTGGLFGDVTHAQQGLMAGVVDQPTVLFGERATGGEAFIPRYGNPNRSKMILATAAGWYGMELHPKGGSDVGGRGDMVFQTFITNQINAKSILNDRTLVEAIRDTTRYELAQHDHKLLRSLKSR